LGSQGQGRTSVAKYTHAGALIIF